MRVLSWGGGAGGASGEERAGPGARAGTCRRGEGRTPSPHLHPWNGEPGTPRRAPSGLRPRARWGAHRGSERGAQATGRGRTHIPRASASEAPGGRRGRGERCPSVSLRTGARAQPRLSGDAAADADPARGAGRGGAGVGARGAPAGAAGDARPVSPGVRVRAWSLSGRPVPEAAALPALPTPAPPAPPLPPPRSAREPSPLRSEEVPPEFLGGTFTAKGSETHKDAEREEGRERRCGCKSRSGSAALGPSPP